LLPPFSYYKVIKQDIVELINSPFYIIHLELHYQDFYLLKDANDTYDPIIKIKEKSTKLVKVDKYIKLMKRKINLIQHSYAKLSEYNLNSIPTDQYWELYNFRYYFQKYFPAEFSEFLGKKKTIKEKTIKEKNQKNLMKYFGMIWMMKNLHYK